jgi:class 3 adenylate cyclase
VDVSDVLRAVQVPTHVIRQDSDRIPEAAVRRAAGLIPDAVCVSLPAVPPGSSLGEAYSPIIDYAEKLILGSDRLGQTDRALGTVLFTDIVGSTELLVRLGDVEYRKLRDAHERQVHLAVENAGGRLIKVLGDGTLSVFDGPGRAVRCADTIRREAADLGLDIRAGVHTGEIERAGLDIAGLNVHIGARVSAAAGVREILVSPTVRDLVAGSGLAFVDRGEHQLKGVPGSWRLYALTSLDAADELEMEPSIQTFADRAAVVTARRAPGAMRTMMRVGNSIQRRRARRGRAEKAST